jgi:hypothetical protein
MTLNMGGKECVATVKGDTIEDAGTARAADAGPKLVATRVE